MSSPTPFSERPTLPPLHTLGLPAPGRRSPAKLPGINEMYDGHEHKLSPLNNALTPPTWQHRARQTSVSSVASRLSASPPPSSSGSPPPSARLPSPPTGTARNGPKVRIVLTDSIDHADAVLVYPPYTHSLPMLGPLDNVDPTKPLLVVGAGLERLRKAPKTNVRMHPYRLARPSDSRRGSTASLPPTN